MTTIKKLMGILAIAALPCAPTSLADSDSSASAAAGFHAAVQDSAGVIIRVPVRDGREDSTAADMRLTDERLDLQPESAVVDAFEKAMTIPQVAVAADSSTSSHDSSTWGWHNWRGYGYGNYYYSSYYPRYSYNNYNYNYSYGYRFNNYGYGHYNYYYYPRYSCGYYGNYYNWYY